MRLPLGELTNQLNEAEARVKEWSEHSKDVATHRFSQHLESLQQSKDALDVLKAGCAKAEQQAQELQQRLQAEQARESSEVQVLNAAQAEAAVLPAQLQSLQQLVDRESATLAQKEAELQQQATEADSKLAALRVQVEQFRTYLGLHLDYAAGSEELRLVFTHINAADWSQTFWIAVRVLPSEEFEVLDCQPQLYNLPQLSAQLNATQDFSKFVRSVRKGFVQLTV